MWLSQILEIVQKRRKKKTGTERNWMIEEWLTNFGFENWRLNSEQWTVKQITKQNEKRKGRKRQKKKKKKQRKESASTRLSDDGDAPANHTTWCQPVTALTVGPIHVCLIQTVRSLGPTPLHRQILIPFLCKKLTAWMRTQHTALFYFNLLKTHAFKICWAHTHRPSLPSRLFIRQMWINYLFHNVTPCHCQLSQHFY